MKRTEFVQVYTGDGKGKTTAALGLTLRAVGAGWNVFIGQFAKGMKCSELAVLERLSDQVTVRQFGRSCFVKRTPDLADRQVAAQGLTECKRVLLAGKHRLVILDEANVAVAMGLLPVDALLELVVPAQRPGSRWSSQAAGPTPARQAADL